jgi:hypothetical protein
MSTTYEEYFKDENQKVRKGYNKEYYQKNREKILSAAKTKVTCEKCGRIVNSCSLQLHQGYKICLKNSILKENFKNLKK